MYQRNQQIQSSPAHGYQQSSIAGSATKPQPQPQQQQQLQQGLQSYMINRPLGQQQPELKSSASMRIPYQQGQQMGQNAPFVSQQVGIAQQQPQYQGNVNYLQKQQMNSSNPAGVQFQLLQGGSSQILGSGASTQLSATGSSQLSQNASMQNALSNSRILSPERKIEEVDVNLSLENDKLQRQLAQLETLVEAFTHFERTKNLHDLKSFNARNQLVFSELIDEYYDVKSKLEEEKRKGEELRNQTQELRQIANFQSESSSNGYMPLASGPLLSLQNQELARRLEQLKEEQNRIKGRFVELESQRAHQEYYLETKDLLQQQIQNQEETEKQLELEVNIMMQSNKKLVDQFNKKDFFKEYDFMCREQKGLAEQNERVQQEIKVKEEELIKLKGRQEDPFPQCGMGPPPRS